MVRGGVRGLHNRTVTNALNPLIPRGDSMVPWLQLAILVRRSLPFAAVLVLAGCPAGDDAPGDPDAAGASGLVVSWNVSPGVPGALSTDVTVESVQLRLSSLRVIGDAAPSGDPRTSRGTTDLIWDDGHAPAAVELLTAPPGVYSRLELGVGGDDEKLEITGQARVEGTWYRFEIEDERGRALTLPLALELEAGQQRSIPVGVDVAAIVGVVPFDELPVLAGQIYIDDDGPTMDAVWAALEQAVTTTAIPGATP